MAGFPAAIARTYLASCLEELGEFAERTAFAVEAMQIAETMGQAWTLTLACFRLGYLHIRKGDFSKAITLLERGLTICRDHHVPLYSLLNGSHLGYAYAVSGRPGEALPLLDQTRERALAERLEIYPSLALACLGEAYLRLGRVDDAVELGATALHLCRERKERGQAMALAEELGMRPLLAHCHLGLGKLYRRTGQQQAQEHLTIATAMYREMDMGFWLPQAEAALRG